MDGNERAVGEFSTAVSVVCVHLCACVCVPLQCWHSSAVESSSSADYFKEAEVICLKLSRSCGED